MNILAIDTAAGTFSIGLSVDDVQMKNSSRYYLAVDGAEKHSELIMDGADTLLRIAGAAKESLGAIACMEGPGSFAGLRIGFAAAKGLALALSIPILPFPTLDCMASPFGFWPGLVLPVMDAKKKSVFTALYCRGERLTGYMDIEIKGLQKIIEQEVINKKPSFPKLLVTGPAVSLVIDELGRSFPGTVTDAAVGRGYANELLNLAREKVIINGDLTDYSVGPLYLRKSDAEINEKTDKLDGK